MGPKKHHLKSFQVFQVLKQKIYRAEEHLQQKQQYLFN